MSDSAFHGSRRGFVGGAALLAGAGLAGLDVFAAAPVAAGQVVDTATRARCAAPFRPVSTSFKGVPYGASTAGANRFMPPAKPRPWTGVRECTRYGHQSPQNMSLYGCAGAAGRSRRGLRRGLPGAQRLDARRERRPQAPRDVLVPRRWLRAGKRLLAVDRRRRLSRGAAMRVVVTVNHRLNIFGYLHLGDIGGREIRGVRQRRHARPRGGARNGCATTSREFGGDPRQRHDLRRIGRGRENLLAARHAAGERVVPSCRDPERLLPCVV